MKKIIIFIVSIVLCFSVSIFPCFAVTSSLHLSGNEWTVGIGSYGGENTFGNPYYIGTKSTSSAGTYYVCMLAYDLPELDLNADYVVEFSFWLNCLSSSKADVGGGIQFLNSAGEEISYVEFFSYEDRTTLIDIKNQKVKFTAPSGTSSARLYYSSVSVSNSQIYFYDIDIIGNNVSQQIAEGFEAQQQQINQLSNDIQAGFEQTQQGIQQGFDDLNNAGSEEPPLDTDISAFQSAIDTMNGWLDELDAFADSIDEAGQTASEYISKGTEMFNGFMSVAPTAVIVLVGFGIVFIVVRKIVGR